MKNKQKNGTYVWRLSIEGPGTLGGPMGTEHTDHLEDILFKTEASAKLYAEKESGEKLKWDKHSNGHQSVDAIHILFSLDKMKVLE